MKKLLIVVDERKMGGVSIVLEDYLNNLDLTEFHTDLLILHNNGDRFVNIPNTIKKIYLDKYFDFVDIGFKELMIKKNIIGALKKTYNSFLIKTGFIESKIKKIREKENIKDYDIEICFKAGFCTLFTAFGNSKKKINWVHEDYKVFDPTVKYKKTFYKSYKNMDKIVVVSDDARNNFNELYSQNDKTITITNYISEDRILRMGNENLDITIPKNVINFVSVGRLVEQKKFDRIINAVDRLKKEGLSGNICVNIIGDGPLRYYLQNMIDKKKLNDNITLIGQKNNPYNIIKQHDIYILSSECESFGLVRVEALILGIPVLTTDVACTKQILDNDKYGITIENSEEGIYKGMKKIITEKNTLNELKQKVIGYTYSLKNKEILEKIQLLLKE